MLPSPGALFARGEGQGVRAAVSSLSYHVLTQKKPRSRGVLSKRQQQKNTMLTSYLPYRPFHPCRHVRPLEQHLLLAIR